MKIIFLILFLFSAILSAANTEQDSSKIKQHKKVKNPAELAIEFKSKKDSADRLLIIKELIKISNLEKDIDLWIELLEKSRSSDVEILMISHLSNVKSNRAIIPIAKKLRAPRADVREKAAVILSEIGNDIMFPEILPLAFSKKPIERIYFLQALRFLYDKRFEHIVAGLINDKNKSVQIYALKCAVHNELESLLYTIRQAVNKSANYEFQIEGINSLVKLNDHGSRGLLQKTLRSPDDNVRDTSIRAINSLGIHVSPYYIAEVLRNEKIRELKFKLIDLILKSKGNGGTDSLIKVISRENDPVLLSQAIHALSKRGYSKRSSEVIKKFMDHGNNRVRAQACHTYASFEKRINEDKIHNILLSDKSRYVKSACLHSMLKSKPHQLREMLYDIYITGDDPVYRELVRKAIRKVSRLK